MKDVSEELGGIREVIIEKGHLVTAGQEQVQALHEIVNNSVRRIQEHVDSETDIESLKAGISDSLEGIRSGIDEYVNRDIQRFAEEESRNEELRERIARMEDETAVLQKQLHRSSEKLMRDALTGVRNRLAYDEVLAQELSRFRRYNEPFCLVVVDIDHFKAINDNFGHSAGDKALKLVAGLVDERIRDADFLFRVGGEEFVLLLPKTGPSSARPLVEDIREAVGGSGFHYESKPVSITLSAGLTVVREEDTAETLYNRADDAMYRAKKAGRDRLVILE